MLFGVESRWLGARRWTKVTSKDEKTFDVRENGGREANWETGRRQDRV